MPTSRASTVALVCREWRQLFLASRRDIKLRHVYPRRAIDNALVQELVCLLPRLIDLDLSECSSIDERALLILDSAESPETTEWLQERRQRLHQFAVQVRRLILRDCWSLSGAGLLAILRGSVEAAMVPSGLEGSRFGRLQSLSLFACTNIKSEQLEQVLRVLATHRSLQLLDLTQCDVRDSTLVVIGEYLSGTLTHLNLTDCGLITDSGIRSLCRCQPSTDVAGDAEVTDDTASARRSEVELERQPMALEWLSLTSCYGITDMALRFVAMALVRLRHLSLQVVPISNVGVRYLSQCRRLRSLDLSGCSQVTDDVILLLPVATGDVQQQQPPQWPRRLSSIRLPGMRRLSSWSHSSPSVADHEPTATISNSNEVDDQLRGTAASTASGSSTLRSSSSSSSADDNEPQLERVNLCGTSVTVKGLLRHQRRLRGLEQLLLAPEMVAEVSDAIPCAVPGF